MAVFRLIVLYFFCIFSQFLHATDEKVFSKTESRKYVLKYHPEEGNSASNYILKEVSAYHLVSINKAEIVIYFDEEIALYRQSGDIFKLTLNINNFRFEGLTKFEGFRLDDVLIPDLSDFNIVINENGLSDEVMRFSAIPFADASPELISLEIGKRGQIPQKIDVEWKKMYFTPETRNVYDKKIQSIYNYLAAGYILNQSIISAESVSFQDLKQLPFALLKIVEVRKADIMLNEGNFGTGFLLPESDSLKYHEILKKLSSHAIRLKTLFSIALDSIIPGSVIIDSHTLADSLISLQINYLDQTASVNHYFTPMITSLARIDKHKQTFNELTDGFGSLAEKGGHQSGKQAFEHEFIDELFHLYIRKADAYILNENFTYAIALLQNAQDLCTIYQLDCSENLFQTISRAKYGIYYSYLSIAGQAFEVSKLQMAERYLKMAGEFQKANKDYIISDVSVQRYYNRLLIKLVEEAKNLLLSNKPDQALENLIKAEEYCENLSPDDCGEYVTVVRKQAKRAIYRNLISKAEALFKSGKNMDALDKIEEASAFQINNQFEVPVSREYRNLFMQVKQKEYEQMLADAQMALKSDDAEGARVFTKKAIEIQSSFGFERKEVLESIIPEAKKEEIRQKIEEANRLIWDQQLAEAANRIQEIRKQIFDGAMDADLDLMKPLRRLDSLYLVISCSKADELFSISLFEAERNYHSGNLKKGYFFFKQASDVQLANPECSFDLQLLVTLEQKYQSYALSRINYDSAISALEDKRYNQAISFFDQAWRKVTTDTVRASVFDQVDYAGFVQESGDVEFYNASGSWLIENGRIPEAFSVVKAAFHKGIVVKSYKYILEVSGRYFAELDFSALKNEKHHPIPQKYTGTDSWLKEFTKAYLARWKEMKGAEKEKL